MGIDGQRLHQ